VPCRALNGGQDNGEEGSGKLPLRVKLAFAMPSFASSAMVLPTAIHINKFYADTLLVDPGTLAMGARASALCDWTHPLTRSRRPATAIARAFDTLMDPLFGWLSDSTNTRWGRRKPYIAVGAPLNAILYILLFAPPASLSPTGAATWFTVFFALYLMVPM
jgi:Na+/melibiose symporter-like transporter